jgi:hypothetical protein
MILLYKLDYSDDCQSIVEEYETAQDFADICPAFQPWVKLAQNAMNDDSLFRMEVVTEGHRTTIEARPE